MNLESMVGYNENILWKGKPDKKCFLLESIFNPLLPFAIVWALFDIFFISTALGFGFGGRSGAMPGGFGMFLIPFFMLHLMPVWIYLGGVLFAVRKYKNTAYVITDKGIYVSGGTFVYTYQMKPFTDISHINLRRGIFDQMLGVGDVISDCSHGAVTNNGHNHAGAGLVICDIPDYENVYKMVKQLQTDVFSDTMYPNDLRPNENHGYQTAYKGDNRW